MLDYIQRERFTELIISTPGPIGLCALGCAKILGLRTTGIYHTDFPQYARFLSDDAFMESMVWNYMHWFYGQLDLVYVNSEFYRRCWIDRGILPDKLRIFPRGLDTELFSPDLRDSTFWEKRGAKGPVLLYVGRVSKEKDLNSSSTSSPPSRKSGSLSPSPSSVKAPTAPSSRNFSRRPLHRHPHRPRTRHRLRFRRSLRLPQHHRHLRQRGRRGHGRRPPRRRLRRRRPTRTRQNVPDGPRLPPPVTPPPGSPASPRCSPSSHQGRAPRLSKAAGSERRWDAAFTKFWADGQ